MLVVLIEGMCYMLVSEVEEVLVELMLVKDVDSLLWILWSCVEDDYSDKWIGYLFLMDDWNGEWVSKGDGWIFWWIEVLRE